MSMRFMRSIIFIGFSAGLASCVSLIGGIGLEIVAERLLPLVPLIVAMPALNTMAGDYSAIIAAHAGDPSNATKSKKELIKAVSKAIWVNIIGVLVLSLVIAYQREYLFSSVFVAKFIIFVVFSMVAVVTAMFIITSILDRVLKKQKLNPDDLLIPVVTSISDLLMLGLIALSAVVLFI
jgi:cation transporter-like permease